MCIRDSLEPEPEALGGGRLVVGGAVAMHLPHAEGDGLGVRLGIDGMTDRVMHERCRGCLLYTSRCV